MLEDQLSRRDTVKGLGALALASGSATASARAAAPPNIIFILADDLGYADVSCYGRSDYATPAIDRLAAQGVRFTQAYANSAVCSATRTALITGRYQYRLPIGLEEPLNGRNVALPPSHPTLPSLLRTSGYRTALIGKWHLGELPGSGPRQSGYDEFFGIRGGAADYFTHRGVKAHDLWDNDQEVQKTGYLTDLLGDRAVETVDRFAAGGKPFLISLHFNAPHWPWEGPAGQAESQRIAKRPDPLALADFDGGDLATYAAMVIRMDWQIGRVVDRLTRLGIADNTIVIFTSDNGGERFSNVWPFSGRKTELLEGGLRIPAILRWPARVRAGTVSEAQIMSMDWLPTLLAAAGGAPDRAFPSDGRDISAAFGGGPLPERPLFWRYKFNAQRACRIGDLKYLKIRENEFLFDVAADPLERANLKDRQPDRFTALVQAWTAWNATMLPIDPASFSHAPSGKYLADRMEIDDMPPPAPPKR